MVITFSHSYVIYDKTTKDQNLLIQVFKRNNKIVYLHSKAVPSLPNIDHPYTNLDHGFHSKLFGATIHGNIVIGVFNECLGVRKSFSGAISYNSSIYNLEKDENNDLRWVVVNSKDDDAGWIRSMCESQVWAEDERFRNCTGWKNWR